MQQPGIRVGTLPEGVHSEVYIAPQLSTKRKGKGKDAEETDAASGVASLVVIPDSALRPLEDLKVEFGDNLRIAVDPETSFRAITGSHIRVTYIFLLYHEITLTRRFVAREVDAHGVYLPSTCFSRTRRWNQCSRS